MPARLPAENHPHPRPRRRLSRSGDFDRVYREGSSRANRHLVLYAFPNQQVGEQVGEQVGDQLGGEVRLGVTVGRKIGGAVERNRVKRAIREAFWTLSGELPEGHDFVVVARPGVEKLIAAEGTAGLSAALGELAAERAGSV